MIHDEVVSMALLSLDALEPTEVAAAARHATGCPGCREALAADRRTAADLALAAAPVTPDPTLRQRILDAAAALPQQVPLVKPARSRPALRPRRRAERAEAIAEQVRFLDSVGGPIVRTVPLAATRASTGGPARASAQLYLTGTGPAGIIVAGLPDPGAQVYQLWRIAGGKPAPMQAFRPGPHGQALVNLARSGAGRTQGGLPEGGEAFAISLERAPGLAAPQGPILLTSAA